MRPLAGASPSWLFESSTGAEEECAEAAPPHSFMCPLSHSPVCLVSSSTTANYIIIPAEKRKVLKKTHTTSRVSGHKKHRVRVVSTILIKFVMRV